MVGHEGLASCDPDAALIRDILALLLKRLEVFFLCVSPRPRSARQTVPRCTSMPWLSASSLASSSSVISPFSATRASIQPVTPASLPCPPPLPCRRGASEPLSRRSLISSFTNFGDTRKCRAASRCP
jgi:hypothetical protein